MNKAIVILLVITLVGSMARIKDITPKLKSLPSAEDELQLKPGEVVMGERVGGLSMYSNALKRGYGNNVFGADDNGIWLGSADFNNAPFRVNMSGHLVSTSATITGTGKNFVSTLTWTATDEDTASWGSGTIKTSDGISYSIDAGNTGNITQTTYVYLDPATSTTVLQTTTTATDAVGGGRVLIATIQQGAAGAKSIINVVGAPGTTIDGDRIVTGKIASKDGNTFFDLDNDLLQISDENNTTVIDAKGLVSTTAFVSDSVVSQLNTRTTSSDSFVDVSNTSISFTLARQANVLFLLAGDFSNYAADGGIASQYVALDIDGTLYPDSSNGFGNTHFWADVAGDDVTTTLSTWQGHYLATLGAGSHTAKLKFRKQGVATVDARVANTQVTYIILGK